MSWETDGYERTKHGRLEKELVRQGLHEDACYLQFILYQVCYECEYAESPDAFHYELEIMSAMSVPMQNNITRIVVTRDEIDRLTTFVKDAQWHFA